MTTSAGFPFSGDGRLAVEDNSDLPAAWSSGVPFDTNGALAVESIVPTDHLGRWPLSGKGRICVSTGAIEYTQSGIPFAADGTVATETAPATHISNNLPFTASGKIAIGAAHVSDYYGHWKANQAVGSGPFVDSSPANNPLPLGTSIVDDATGIWGLNPGVASMPGNGASSSCRSDTVFPSSYDWTGLSLYVGLWFEQAPGESTTIDEVVANGGTGAVPGWRVQVTTDGGFRFATHDGVSSAATEGSDFRDGDSGVEHHIGVLFDGTQDLVSMWFDGLVDTRLNAFYLPDSAARLNAAHADPSGVAGRFAIGTAATSRSAPCRISDIHLLLMQGVPAGVGNLSAYLFQNRYKAISESVLRG